MPTEFMLNSTDELLDILRVVKPEGNLASLDVESLQELLLACTTKSPFTHIDGSLSCQVDGVAMGSPLGVTFANFYICHADESQDTTYLLSLCRWLPCSELPTRPTLDQSIPWSSDCPLFYLWGI